MTSSANNSKRNSTQRRSSQVQYRSRVSGARSAGSMRQRQGRDFSQRSSRSSSPVRSVQENAYQRASTELRAASMQRNRKSAATSRRSKTTAGVSRSRSRNAQGYPSRRTQGSSVRQASQSQRRSSASEAARRRSEYYLRRRKRTQQLRIRYATMAVLVMIIIFLILQIFPVVSSAQVEVGTVINPKDFLRFTFMGASFPGGSADYDKNTPGTYDITVRSGLFDHKIRLTVVDTFAPVVAVKDVSVGMGTEVKPEDFIESIEDGSATKVSFVNEPDLSLTGQTQEVTLSVKDAGGNETVKTANLTVLPIATHLDVELGTGVPSISSFMAEVTEPDDENYLITDLNAIDFYKPGEYTVDFCWRGKNYSATMKVEDTLAPVFDLAEDFTSYLGESIRYKQHVDVWDYSGSCELEIDTSKVDPETLGTYDVTYTAKDPYNHSTTVTVKMTIAEKTADEALLFEKVDAILADIIRDDMSQKDKVTAIHHYANTNFLFVNDSDKSDYVKAALTMLDIRQGDCYSFFALSKALLTRAGIKNVDIYTLDGTNEHYWNLVDIDDGHGWYHYDSTPTAVPMEILFWTESQLQPINDGRYDYDKSKFPKVS